MSAVVAAVLLGIAAVPAGAQESEKVITLDFEDLPPNPPGELQSPIIRFAGDFYAEQGIVFDPEVFGFNAVFEGDPFARSGTGFIVPQCPVFEVAMTVPAEICLPVTMWFDRDVSDVEVYVGWDNQSDERELTLEALDENGKPFTSTGLTVKADTGPIPIDERLFVELPEGGIYGVQLYWIGGSPVPFLVDDVSFQPFVGNPFVEATDEVVRLTATDETVVDSVSFINTGDVPITDYEIALRPNTSPWLEVARGEGCLPELDLKQECRVEIQLLPQSQIVDLPPDSVVETMLTFEAPEDDIAIRIPVQVAVPAVDPVDPVDNGESGEVEGVDPNNGDEQAQDEQESPSDDPSPDDGVPPIVWLIIGPLGALAVAWISRRLRRSPRLNIPPPPVIPPPPTPTPPPPNPTPPPPTNQSPADQPPPPKVDLRVTNTTGSQVLHEAHGPVLTLSASIESETLELIPTDESKD